MSIKSKTSRRWEWMVGLAALAVELAPLFCTHEAFASPRSPEQDTLEAARHIKPISDEEWKAIAGERITEKYQIIRGDTLSGISKRLFGDPKYWPKLYALNNDSITNPHLIRPGNAVIFQSGTGTSLPNVGISIGSPTQITASDAPPAGAMSSMGPTSNEEWRKLPKQSWEFASRVLPANVDALGFDKRVKLSFGRSKGQELESLATSEKLTTLGRITGSRSEASYLSTGDSIYIRSTQIQVGETYAITHEPNPIKARKSDRKGNAYPLLGRVKIIGVRENLFIGKIISAQNLIARGDELIADPGRTPDLTPIPAPAGIEGVVILNKLLSTHMSAQHKQVFINRGTSDGIQPGMVFRAYEHYDPSNEKKITSSDFIIDADMMVVHATEHFCSALVINSISPFSDGSAVSALTDVSSLTHQRSQQYKDLDLTNDKPAKPSELDELDQLDSSGDLGREERLELDQLENWKGNPEPTPEPNPDASPIPDAAPTPTPDSTLIPEPVVEPTPEPQSEPSPAPTSELSPPEMSDTPPAPPSEAPAEAPSDVSNEAPVEAPLTTPEPTPGA